MIDRHNPGVATEAGRIDSSFLNAKSMENIQNEDLLL